MKFLISHMPIDVAAAKEAVADVSCGAVVVFEGWVRNHNDGRQVVRLEYEVYRPLAEQEGAIIIAEACAQYGASHALCIHRAGLMEPGETAVAVCVSSPHRSAAFDACRYIIDQTKTRLPIWKKEHYASGISAWVNCEHCVVADAVTQ